MECVAFYFLNNHVGRHVLAIFQDDNVKKSGSNCGGKKLIIFTHELAPNSLKVSSPVHYYSLPNYGDFLFWKPQKCENGPL